MRRVIFAIALVPLLACGSAVAGDAPSTDPAAAPDIQKPAAAGPTQPRKTVKRVSKTPADGRPAAGSLPLSAAAAYASEHSASLPVSPAPRPAPPPARTWTGFYIGAGAGVAAQP
jgi:hypothetical protein